MGLLDRGADSLEVANGANAGVEVKYLPQRHVERANPAANGSRERTLDGDAELLHRVDRFLRQPILELLEGFFPGEDLHPGDLALALIRPLDRSVEHAH